MGSCLPVLLESRAQMNELSFLHQGWVWSVEESLDSTFHHLCSYDYARTSGDSSLGFVAKIGAGGDLPQQAGKHPSVRWVAITGEPTNDVCFLLSDFFRVGCHVASLAFCYFVYHYF